MRARAGSAARVDAAVSTGPAGAVAGTNAAPGVDAKVAVAAECRHCRLPVPAAEVDPSGGDQFCCNGCRTVYAAIHTLGLDAFYRLRADGDAGVRPVPTGQVYEALDHEAFHSAHVRRDDHGTCTTELALEGLHCAACVWLIERLPRVLPGVLEARVDMGRSHVGLTWKDDVLPLSRIAATLDSLGYPCHPARVDSEATWRRGEERRRLVEMAVAGAIAANVMLISFALFGGMFHIMQPEYRRLFRWTGLALTLLAIAWPGRVFLRGAVSSLRARALHMDVPVALALTLGTLWGAVNTVREVGETYFESITAVIFLLLIGRFVSQRQQRTTHEAITLLFCLTPSTARRLEEGVARTVPTEGLKQGDLIELRPGDTVPADGAIVSGQSTFDLSLLTGESRPVQRAVGERVFSGTVNLRHTVVVEVERTGTLTRLGGLMALVERYARDRPPIVRLADRVAHHFVIVVVVLAAVTTAVWWTVDPGEAIEHAIALLIVTCPCALGLATPLAVVAALGRAARRGILIKGGEVLEELARPGVMLLDKTGTLTRGRARIELWEGDRAVLPAVVDIESQVAHPVAHALVEAFGAEPSTPARFSVEHLPGFGVIGRAEGDEVVIGSRQLLAARGIPLPPWGEAAVARGAAQGLSPVLVARNGSLCGVAGFGDAPHPDARESLTVLREVGWSLRLLSGDAQTSVEHLGRAVGLADDELRGEVAPESKAATVAELRHDGRRVVMVGDGVNDAAALSAATVGVAVHGGAEASLAAADVYLRRPGLGPLVELVRGAQRTLRTIRVNIAVALAYNLITGALAMTGRMDPLIAAILMPISSLTVVTLSWRAKTFGE